MIDRARENGHVPYSQHELNELLASGLRQMRVAASGVLPNGKMLHESAANRLSSNGMNDAEKALRRASQERIKLNRGLSLEAYKRGVNCTLFCIDLRALERNPELARL